MEKALRKLKITLVAAPILVIAIVINTVLDVATQNFRWAGFAITRILEAFLFSAMILVCGSKYCCCGSKTKKQDRGGQSVNSTAVSSEGN